MSAVDPGASVPLRAGAAGDVAASEIRAALARLRGLEPHHAAARAGTAEEQAAEEIRAALARLPVADSGGV